MSQIRTLGGNYVTHFTYRPNGLDEGVDWAIACMPEVKDFRTSAEQPNYLRSDDTRTVTCQECKRTTIFREMQRREPK